MSPLRWACKSLRRLVAELKKLGHQICHTVVGELHKKQKFSLQANRKTREGADNPTRDAQFHFINDAVSMTRFWRQSEPEEVRVHDFLIERLGRAVPYGIYDLAANMGWINGGFAASSA